MVYQASHVELARSILWAIIGVAVSSGPIGAIRSAWGAEPSRVAVVHSYQKSYRDAAAAIEEVIKQAGHTCVLIELPKGTDTSARARVLKRLADAKPTVVATGGTTATSLALEALPDTPVIFFMVPNALDALFMADADRRRKRTAGVTTDIAPKEQVTWLAKLHPLSGRFAVLHGPRSKRTVQAIKTAGRARGIDVLPIDAKKDQFPKAIDTLNEKHCDGVLMVADANVYNSPNVRRLLLWGLRQKKPVWAFSANVVKAGALAGLYVDSKAVGQQAAELIEKVIAGTAVERIGLQYPRDVQRAVNVRTAKSIGVPLGSIPKTGTVRFGEQQ